MKMIRFPDHVKTEQSKRGTKKIFKVLLCGNLKLL